MMRAGDMCRVSGPDGCFAYHEEGPIMDVRCKHRLVSGQLVLVLCITRRKDAWTEALVLSDGSRLGWVEESQLCRLD